MTTEGRQSFTPGTTVPLRYLEDGQDLRGIPELAEDGTGNQLVFAERKVNIRNGRAREQAFQLDREGFTLEQQVTSVTDFEDEGQVSQIYANEVKQLVARVTGATRVEIFNATRRTSGELGSADKRPPLTTIHNDFTAQSALYRLDEFFRELSEDPTALKTGRFAIVMVWRSCRGRVESYPLALCDATTVTPEQVITIVRKGKGWTQQAQVATFDEQNQWYYFPNLGMHETLLFKSYDTMVDGRARFAFHSAFADPATPPFAPPRESIETRCFAFFS